ncbi:hypothetical protein [Flavobacterium oreochromis]|uniref:DUF4304 domain-containing protein n=1 Tax=Flavobacterium columnare TaxID=996 RepID=A0A246G9E3_9FLAO|nr:hypothetical protein [Flavobacterium oreochromis]OWP74346.1 hypothetical protein BWK62_14570 [Flavobacterium oreochromis]
MKEQINELNEKLTQTVSFSSYGFSLYAKDEIDFAYKYHRKENEVIDKITYSFEKDKWGEKFSLSSIGFGIVIPIVNTILGNIEFEKKFYLPDDEYTVNQIPDYDKKNDYYSDLIDRINIIENKNINSQVFEHVKIEFVNQLNETVLPFFFQIKSLQDINDKILEKEQWQNWSNYIFGKTYFKAMIILKLVGNEKRYNEFTTMYISRIEEAIKNGRDDLQAYLNDVIKLDQYLQSNVHKDLV